MATGKDKAYTPGHSKAAKYVKIMTEPQTYGSATLSGTIYSDTVCLQTLPW